MEEDADITSMATSTGNNVTEVPISPTMDRTDIPQHQLRLAEEKKAILLKQQEVRAL